MNEPPQEKKLGILDFLKMIYNGHPEYSLIAVKAPIDETVQAFIEFREGKQTIEWMDYITFHMKERNIASRNIRWEENIPIHNIEEKKEKEDEEFEWGIPFIKIHDSEWTVILRSLFYLGIDEIYGVPEEAKALSIKLQAKAITLIEEDTSAAIGYALFENGELEEEFEQCPGEKARFQSKLRVKPDIDLDDEDMDYDLDWEYDVSNDRRVQFVDALFRELGIYLPGCSPTTDKGEPALLVEVDSENTIVRADWVSLK